MRLKNLLIILFISIFISRCQIVRPKKLEHSNLTHTFIQQPEFAKGQLGFVIYDLDNNTTVESFQENKLFIPCSNIKILTCLASKYFLNDSLVGWLYNDESDTIFLKPMGDPSFLVENVSTKKIENILATTSKKVVLIYEEPKSPKYGYGWAWDDFDQDYMSEINNLPINKNRVRISSSSTIKEIFPDYFKNSIQINISKSKDSNFTITRQYAQNKFILTNINNKKFSHELPFIVGDSFKLQQHILQALYPNLQLSVINSSEYKGKLLPIKTHSVDTVLKKMMLNSDNQVAEQLLVLCGNSCVPSLSIKQIIDSTISIFFNYNKNEIIWVDASGLSRYNLISPISLLNALITLYKLTGKNWIETVFSAGNTGTLKNRFVKYPNQIRAKTGTLKNHLALSGYIESLQNKHYIFSFLVGNHNSSSAKIRTLIENYLNLYITSQIK